MLGLLVAYRPLPNRETGISAIVTAFGVGELSAINGIAGAYAEFSPIVHIVGTPPLAAQNAGACLHHSLGDGNFRIFAEMAAKVTVAQTNLTDPSIAVGEIDRVLSECIAQSRPVYIEIPTSSVHAKVPASGLDTPLRPISSPDDDDVSGALAEAILDKIYLAKQPLIIVDAFTRRFGFAEEANELIRATGFPTMTTPCGKGIASEQHANYHGVYAGLAAKEAITSWVQGCDLVLKLGPLNADVNSFGFSALTDPKVTVSFHHHVVDIPGVKQPGEHSDLQVKTVLRKVLKGMDKSRLPKYDPLPDVDKRPSEVLKGLPDKKAEDKLEQDEFWLRMSSFLRPGDVVLADASTALLGVQDMILPDQAQIINSGLWASIGFALGAAQGVSIALREMLDEGTRSAGRTVLFEGDGSFQMTAQIISDMIRQQMDAIIFVVNNDGYTVERYIHGRDAEYNDVQPWRYLEAPKFFGAPLDDPSYPVVTRRAATWGELQAVLDDKAMESSRGLIMVELVFARYDCPEIMKQLLNSAAQRNSGGGTGSTEPNGVSTKAG